MSQPALNRRLAFAGVLTTLVMVLSLAGIPAARAQDANTVLRIHQLVYPETADPQKSGYSTEIAFLVSVYEGLTRLGADGQTSPAAAERWEFNDDGTVVTFHLRDGLTYADGSPLTAERFRYAVERTCDPSTAGAYQYVLFDIVGCQEFATLYAAAEGATPVPSDDAAAYEAARAALGVAAPDDQTLEVRLNQPAPYFPAIAGLWVFFPVKAEIVAEAGEGWWTEAANHVGNGPYSVAGMEEDQLIALQANEHYWGGRPTLDGIELVYVPDPAVALEAYEAGDLDVVQPDPAQYPAIAADPVLSEEFLSFPGTNTFGLTFNMQRPPFDEKAVREAFAYAFDRETFCRDVVHGDCVPTQSWLPEGVPGAVATDLYAFDPEKARQALAASSYGGPDDLPPIEYVYASDIPEERTRGEWMAGQYRDILGVELQLVPMESQAWVATISDSENFPQTTMLGWFQDYPDPQNWLSLLWQCGALFAAPAGYCNAGFDDLVSQGDRELDPETRIGYYEEAHHLLLADAPMVFVANQANVFLVKPYVTGYQTTPSDGEWPGQWASPLTLDVQRPA